MNNITNNKIIVFSFSILALLAFGVSTLPKTTYAQSNSFLIGSDGMVYYRGVNAPSNNQNYSPTYYSQTPTYVQQSPTYVNTAPAPTQTATLYSNTTNPNAVTTTPRTVVKAKTTTTTYTTDSTLAANSIFGSNSFMPTGIIQWIFFAILILLLVILVRKLHGGQDRYHAIPMKHD